MPMRIQCPAGAGANGAHVTGCCGANAASAVPFASSVTTAASSVPSSAPNKAAAADWKPFCSRCRSSRPRGFEHRRQLEKAAGIVVADLHDVATGLGDGAAESQRARQPRPTFVTDMTSLPRQQRRRPYRQFAAEPVIRRRTFKTGAIAQELMTDFIVQFAGGKIQPSSRLRRIGQIAGDESQSGDVGEIMVGPCPTIPFQIGVNKTAMRQKRKTPKRLRKADQSRRPARGTDPRPAPCWRHGWRRPWRRPSSRPSRRDWLR